MSYNSKYKGAEVDAALDLAKSAIQEHQDISGLATKEELQGKVDKIDGKQLSTEDFTTALKNKLSGLNNYDDTTINQAVQSLQNQLNTLVSGNASTAVESFNEIVAFLEGIEDSQSLDSIIASIEQQIAAKQDIITDLETIRSGAALGATALQSHQDISGKLDVTTAASTYLTKTDAASTYLGKTAKAASAASADSATKATQDASGNVITSTYATKTELNAKGTYSKPSDGIPKTDLASAVQTSLGKADTALQSYTETDPVFKASAAAGITSTNITSWNEKQEKLVSGTNIKTVNGTSLLGSGNIAISTAYPLSNHGTGSTTLAMTPNTFHVWGTVTTLNLTLGTETSGVANEYLFQFTSGTTQTTLTLPSTVVWANDDVPTIESGYTYVVSIMNKLAIYAKF